MRSISCSAPGGTTTARRSPASAAASSSTTAGAGARSPTAGTWSASLPVMPASSTPSTCTARRSRRPRRSLRPATAEFRSAFSTSTVLGPRAVCTACCTAFSDLRPSAAPRSCWPVRRRLPTGFAEERRSAGGCWSSATASTRSVSVSTSGCAARCAASWASFPGPPFSGTSGVSARSRTTRFCCGSSRHGRRSIPIRSCCSSAAARVSIPPAIWPATWVSAPRSVSSGCAVTSTGCCRRSTSLSFPRFSRDCPSPWSRPRTPAQRLYARTACRRRRSCATTFGSCPWRAVRPNGRGASRG